jgi:hypothetical protein
MKFALAACAAVLAAAPAFAQTTTTTTTTVQSSTGVPVVSGTGVAVKPGVPVVHQTTLQAGVLTHAGTSTTSAPGSTTTLNHYWVNVPSWAVSDASFRRWQSLR